IRLLSFQNSRGSRDDRGDLLAEAVAADAQEMIRLAHAELLEEDVAEARIVVLTGVDQDVITQAIQPADDPAQANDLWACAQNGHDLHASPSPWDRTSP